MKQVTRINHVPVAIVEHPFGVNINFILNASSGASSVKVLIDVSEKHTGFTDIALEITDAKAVKQHLHNPGIAITETVEFGNAAFFLARDPDGNVIEFHKPASKL